MKSSAPKALKSVSRLFQKRWKDLTGEELKLQHIQVVLSQVANVRDWQTYLGTLKDQPVPTATAITPATEMKVSSIKPQFAILQHDDQDHHGKGCDCGLCNSNGKSYGVAIRSLDEFLTEDRIRSTMAHVLADSDSVCEYLHDVTADDDPVARKYAASEGSAMHNAKMEAERLGFQVATFDDGCPFIDYFKQIVDDREFEGTEGQDRDNYSDTQDREFYTCDEEDDEDADRECPHCNNIMDISEKGKAKTWTACESCGAVCDDCMAHATVESLIPGEVPQLCMHCYENWLAEFATAGQIEAAIKIHRKTLLPYLNRYLPVVHHALARLVKSRPETAKSCTQKTFETIAMAMVETGHANLRLSDPVATPERFRSVRLDGVKIAFGSKLIALDRIPYAKGEAEGDYIEQGEIVTVKKVFTDGTVYLNEHEDKHLNWNLKINFLPVIE